MTQIKAEKAHSAKTINIYNTLTRKVEPFKPLSNDEVKIYCCGPTVYLFQHIGNFRKGNLDVVSISENFGQNFYLLSDQREYLRKNSRLFLHLKMLF